MATIAINAANGFDTRYEGRFEDANAIAVLSNTLYMVSDTNLFQHSGDDDDGTALSPYLLTGDLTLAGDMEYNIPKCAFTAHGAGSITVTRYIKRAGSAETMTAYSATLASEIDRYDLGLENMPLARAWQFKIAFNSPESGDALETFSVYVNPARSRKHG